MTSHATVEQLARENAGAIEVDLPDQEPQIVVLIGPISFWWEPGQWDSPAHQEYVAWRDAVEAALVKDGRLVYKPHSALRGAWTERAQAINDTAIRMADAVAELTPPGIPIKGTLKEREVALAAGVPVEHYPPGDAHMLRYMADVEARYAAERAAVAV